MPARTRWAVVWAQAAQVWVQAAQVWAQAAQLERDIENLSWLIESSDEALLIFDEARARVEGQIAASGLIGGAFDE